jgi:hypothetical protein
MLRKLFLSSLFLLFFNIDSKAQKDNFSFDINKKTYSEIQNLPDKTFKKDIYYNDRVLMNFIKQLETQNLFSRDKKLNDFIILTINWFAFF